MRRTSLYAAAALAAATLIAQAAAAKDPELLSLGADHFAKTASVTEEAQSTRISTEPGYVERSGLLGEVWHDEFLLARVEHGSGRVSYELDASLTYRGATRSYQTAEFQGVERVETVPISLVKRQRINCPTGECTYTDRYAVPMDEALLRHIAQGYAPGKAILWRFRLVSKGAPDFRGAVSNAEVAGLLVRVDAYLQNPTVAPPPPPPPPPARLNFGVSGLAVAASPDAPERAGVLVVSVSPGSAAQKAGIMTGDILCEVEGRPIHSPADLQAATAAAHSSARIKLYRGTVATTVEVPF
jgi:hypothetical protein